MAKKKKAWKDKNYPSKLCNFNEILLCRMKSKTSLDEIFGVPPQMKSNPPPLTCRKADFITEWFHPQSGFNWKRLKIVSNPESFSGRDDRTRTCGIVLPKHARYQLRHISAFIKFCFYIIKTCFVRPLASHSRLASQIICLQYSLLWLLRFAKTSHCDIFAHSPKARALPVATKPLTALTLQLVNRQVAATPYSSLDPTLSALGNVPSCATSR